MNSGKKQKGAGIMLILALDSATPTAGVALAEDGRILYESFVNYKKTHSETLMPMIDQALRVCEKTLADCTAIAVTIGPGSFTGLRIGLAAAKALSLTTGIPIVGISTLELLAHNVSLPFPVLAASLLDARKQEVYCSIFRCDASQGLPKRLTEETACSPEQFVEQLDSCLAQTGDIRVVLLGDGVVPYAEYFQTVLGNRMAVAPPHLLLPRAAALADLARLHLQQNPEEHLDIMTAKPVYLRLSEAEYRLGKGEL